MGLRSYR